jgi:hypothetical protein
LKIVGTVEGSQQAIAVDMARHIAAALPPTAVTLKLWEIPGVELAFSMYERRRLPLAVDPETDAEKREIVEAIERVAKWLDDGFHEPLVAELREIAESVRP